MAALPLELHARKIGKLLGAATAALLALPTLMLAQAHRMTASWLQLTPSDPRTGIPSDARTSITNDGDSTTISIERRSRSRDDDAGMDALEASRRDPHLHLVVS